MAPDERDGICPSSFLPACLSLSSALSNPPAVGKYLSYVDVGMGQLIRAEAPVATQARITHAWFEHRRLRWFGVWFQVPVKAGSAAIQNLRYGPSLASLGNPRHPPRDDPRTCKHGGGKGVRLDQRIGLSAPIRILLLRQQNVSVPVSFHRSFASAIVSHSNIPIIPVFYRPGADRTAESDTTTVPVGLHQSRCLFSGASSHSSTHHPACAWSMQLVSVSASRTGPSYVSVYGDLSPGAPTPYVRDSRVNFFDVGLSCHPGIQVHTCMLCLAYTPCRLRTLSSRQRIASLHIHVLQ
ncbi:hypothetical protein GGS23DRAFT_4208 [Durotheca rogersii]|uniref:uncharacterized protein n=1 Tax=Durotheca rogersii TaxID=419775 RepID=UPI00221F6203|nr:uncharacterized protein GGS23DRAFT_4208 [Durotheca rogersii]KAI5867958.1 hypothetical protein GGS23DRAFT_4208 [Durotheca rogersii]